MFDEILKCFDKETDPKKFKNEEGLTMQAWMDKHYKDLADAILDSAPNTMNNTDYKDYLEGMGFPTDRPFVVEFAGIYDKAYKKALKEYKKGIR